MARVSSYLNFPGTTEAAFRFYQSVFGGEFNGHIARFKDMPAQPGQPALPDEARDMVLHIELPILGGHVLMGTDAPQCLGFTVAQGNNMHINLEPDTRAQAEHLFNGLAPGGTIEMPLQDMFWGAYFGSLVDQYGIRWMINCATPA